MIGKISSENLSGLPLNQEWQRLLLEMIRSGVSDGDACETMLSTAIGNLTSLYGPQAVARALLPVASALAKATDVPPIATAH